MVSTLAITRPRQADDRQGHHHGRRVQGAIEHGAGELFIGAETDALMMNRSKEDNSHCTYCAKLKSTSVEVTLMSDPSS
jgi:hypothetical protein